MSVKQNFDLTQKLNNYFSNYSGDVNVILSEASSAIKSVLLKNEGQRFDVVFTERDYAVVGKSIVSLLKELNVDFSTLIIDGVEIDSASTKSFFKFDKTVVIVVGNCELISLVAHYATIHGNDCYGVLTQPCAEKLLTNRVFVRVNGFVTTVKINPLKALIVDVELIRKAPIEAFSNSYMAVICKYIDLIDYKYRVLVSGEEFDVKRYNAVKNQVALAFKINSFSNFKDPIIYSELVLSVETAINPITEGGAVELYSDALRIYTTDFTESQRRVIAFKDILEVYETFFANDFSSIISLPDYNDDVTMLTKSTGVSQTYFRKNFRVPSSRRLVLINKALYKLKDGFMAEIEGGLKLYKDVCAIHSMIDKSQNKKILIGYDIKKSALKICTYLSNKQNLLTQMRDMGILRCLK